MLEPYHHNYNQVMIFELLQSIKYYQVVGLSSGFKKCNVEIGSCAIYKIFILTHFYPFSGERLRVIVPCISGKQKLIRMPCFIVYLITVTNIQQYRVPVYFLSYDYRRNIKLMFPYVSIWKFLLGQALYYSTVSEKQVLLCWKRKWKADMPQKCMHGYGNTVLYLYLHHTLIFH